MDSIDSSNSLGARVQSLSSGASSNVGEGYEADSEKTIRGKQRGYADSSFSNILNGALDMAANIVAPGLGTIDNFGSLMQQQMLWQIEMQYYTAESNISKSKHEVAMAPIRNLRVG